MVLPKCKDRTECPACGDQDRGKDWSRRRDHQHLCCPHNISDPNLADHYMDCKEALMKGLCPKGMRS